MSTNLTGLVLAIDTSTVVCAGLARDGEVLGSARVGDHRSHAELLAPTIETLLTRAGVGVGELSGVVVGVGPGPFTGLRVGIAAASTLGWVRGIPVRGVCSLDAIAAAWTQGHRSEAAELLALSDARRGEVYWARYLDGVRVGDPQVCAPDELPELPLIGPGAGLFPQLAARVLDAGAGLEAGWLAAHADQLPEMGLHPLYLRRPDAELPGTRKSALGGGRVALTDLHTVNRPEGSR